MYYKPDMYTLMKQFFSNFCANSLLFFVQISAINFPSGDDTRMHHTSRVAHDDAIFQLHENKFPFAFDLIQKKNQAFLPGFYNFQQR